MIHTASPLPRRVAVLGAAGTGKTRLTEDLITAWGASPHLPPLLVADDPPLMSSVPHGKQDGFDHILLMGLDLAAKNARICDRDLADRALRDTLTRAKQPFTVIYGEGPTRLANALDALRALFHCAGAPTSAGIRPQWVWACDTCSDPDCERKLLSGLLAARAP